MQTASDNHEKQTEKMQSVLDGVANLNEAGIFHAKKGEADLAARAFTGALNKARLLYGDFQEIDSPPSNDTTLQRMSLSSESSAQEAESKRRNEIGFPDLVRLRRFIPWRRSKKPIAFDRKHACECLFQINSKEHISPALCGLLCMFNLAVSHHRIGAEEGGAEFYLRKAINLYELAYSLLVSEEPSDYPFLLAAIVNNLGHANHILGERRRAKGCFELLLMLLLYLVGSGRGKGMSDEVWTQLFSNITSLVLIDRGFAPAA